MPSVEIGDLVIRKSHGGDIVFKVTDIFEDEIGEFHCVLKGMYLRLMADAPLEDLELVGVAKLCKEIVDLEFVLDDLSESFCVCFVLHRTNLGFLMYLF